MQIQIDRKNANENSRLSSELLSAQTKQKNAERELTACQKELLTTSDALATCQSNLPADAKKAKLETLDMQTGDEWILKPGETKTILDGRPFFKVKEVDALGVKIQTRIPKQRGVTTVLGKGETVQFKYLGKEHRIIVVDFDASLQQATIRLRDLNP